MHDLAELLNKYAKKNIQKTCVHLFVKRKLLKYDHKLASGLKN